MQFIKNIIKIGEKEKRKRKREKRKKKKGKRKKEKGKRKKEKGIWGRSLNPYIFSKMNKNWIYK